MGRTGSYVTFGTAALIGICFGSLFAGAVLFMTNARPGLTVGPNGPAAAPAAYNAPITR